MVQCAAARCYITDMKVVRNAPVKLVISSLSPTRFLAGFWYVLGKVLTFDAGIRGLEIRGKVDA